MGVRTLSLAVALVAFASCSTASRPQQDTQSASKQSASADTGLQAWAGTYKYEDSTGKTASGTAAVVDYVLTVSKTAKEATLRIKGFQNDETIRCDIGPKLGGVALKFKSYGNGKTENEFGVTEYQPNAVLFTLEKPAEEQKLITTWEALKPDGVHVKSGEYFHLLGSGTKR